MPSALRRKALALQPRYGHDAEMQLSRFVLNAPCYNSEHICNRLLPGQQFHRL